MAENNEIDDDNEIGDAIVRLLSDVADIPAVKDDGEGLGKKGVEALNAVHKTLLNRPELSKSGVIVAVFKIAAQNNNRDLKVQAVVCMGIFGGLSDEAGISTVARLPELLADPSIARTAEDALLNVAAAHHESWDGERGIGNYFQIAARPYLKQETIERLGQKAADHVDIHRRFLWTKKIDDGIAALKRLEP